MAMKFYHLVGGSQGSNGIGCSELWVLSTCFSLGQFWSCAFVASFFWVVLQNYLPRGFRTRLDFTQSGSKNLQPASFRHLCAAVRLRVHNCL